MSEAVNGFFDYPYTLVGTAGTVTTLAAYKLEMEEYNWEKINNTVIDSATLNNAFEYLNSLSPLQREGLPGIEKGRGELIVPGIIIISSLLGSLEKDGFIVSDFGLLEGALLCL